MYMAFTKAQSETIKWLAILFMVIDHIGLIFFPEDLTWRFVGRLAFPLFAFQLAIGFSYTRSHGIQLRNLLLFGFLSQLPYMWAIQPEIWTLNIFFTLTMSYLLLMSWSKKCVYGFLFLLLASFFIPVDYGIYGVLLPLVFYVFRQRLPLQFIAFVLLTGLYSYVYSPFQLLSVFAIFLIFGVRYVRNVPLSSSKWFFYWFYPGHLLALAIAALLLG